MNNNSESYNSELNRIFNSNKLISNLLLNESFDNGSALDDSFKLGRIDEEEKCGAKERDDYEDDNEGYGDDEEEFELEFLKSNNETVSGKKTENKTKNDEDEDDEDDDEEHFDPIDQVMLQAYEEEENLVLEIEKVQDKELLSVLAQEARLTKQLSVEKLMHYNHQQYKKYKSDLNDTEDGEDTDAGVYFYYGQFFSKKFIYLIA